jgi:hypothetical protein
MCRYVLITISLFPDLIIEFAYFLFLSYQMRPKNIDKHFAYWKSLLFQLTRSSFAMNRTNPYLVFKNNL